MARRIYGGSAAGLAIGSFVACLLVKNPNSTLPVAIALIGLTFAVLSVASAMVEEGR